MAKLNKALFSFSAWGSLGKALSVRRRGSQTIAEKKPIPTDAKSLAQLSWRHMYLKAVALWHALSYEERQEWESNARARHMTGFAWFMSQCLRPNPGIYLPLQGGTMQGDIDMAKHRILKLPVPSDNQEAATKAYVDAAGPAEHGAELHTDITREFFMPATEGFALTGTPMQDGSYGILWGAANVDAPRVYFAMKVPDDFASFTKVEAVWFCYATNKNMRWQLTAQYGAESESKQTHMESPGYGQTPCGPATRILQIQEAAEPLTLPNLAPGDMLGMLFDRQGSSPIDTINADVMFVGLLFTYIANQ